MAAIKLLCLFALVAFAVAARMPDLGVIEEDLPESVVAFQSSALEAHDDNNLELEGRYPVAAHARDAVVGIECRTIIELTHRASTASLVGPLTTQITCHCAGGFTSSGLYSSLEDILTTPEVNDKKKWPIRIATKHLVKPGAHAVRAVPLCLCGMMPFSSFG